MKYLRLFLWIDILFSSSLTLAAEKARTITVMGYGSARAVPDQLEILVGIETIANDPEACIEKNNLVLNKMLKLIETLGISSNDYQSHIASMQPQWESAPQASTLKPRYLARRELKIWLRNIKRYAELLSGLFRAGANSIQQGNMQSSLQVQLADEARKLALENAKSKAELVAQQLGMKLGEPMKVEEFIDRGSFPPFSLSKEVAADTGAAFAPGIIEVQQTFSVVFAVQ